MGTRSLTVVRNEQDKEICVLYRQYDGYPSGHGQELADFLTPFTMTNGKQDRKQTANGMACLAAQIVAHFKQAPGDFYLEPAGARDLGEEYIYTVYSVASVLHLRIQSGAMTFFGLPGSKQDSMNVIYDGPVTGFNPKTAEKAEADLPQPKNDWADSQEHV